MTGYELSRQWFDFTFENPEKINPNHTAMYFFAIEHCNRLGWKRKFGFPSTMVMEAMGIKSYKTYKKTLDDLVDWGFFLMVEKSRNQYSSNIIALVENDKAHDKALDKALAKHSTKQVQSKDSIDKPYNKEPYNKERGVIAIASDVEVLSESIYEFELFWDDYDKKVDRTKCEKKWSRMSESEKEVIKEFVPIYVSSTPEKKYRKNPLSFLNAKTWNDDWSEYQPKAKNHDQFIDKLFKN